MPTGPQKTLPRLLQSLVTGSHSTRWLFHVYFQRLGSPGTGEMTSDDVTGCRRRLAPCSNAPMTHTHKVEAAVTKTKLEAHIVGFIPHDGHLAHRRLVFNVGRPVYLSFVLLLTLYIHIYFNFLVTPYVACGILVLSSGLEPLPLQWKCRVPSTGLPGKP